MSVESLSAYVDDHYLHGHLLTRWITDYVDLEESLAVGSMAQEELAHAAALLEQAGAGLEERDAYVYERPLSAWAPSRLLGAPVDDWPGTVVRGLLLATAAAVRAEGWLTGGGEIPPDAAAVILAEQELHVTHWTRWVVLLGGDERTREQLSRRVSDLLPLAADVFGPLPDGRRLPGSEDFHHRWVERAGAVLARAGLPDGLPASELRRLSGEEQPGVEQVVATVRSLRVGAGDGVRGLYR